MGSWKKRVADLRARNPDAVPGWLRGTPPGPAWYRASWQTDAGVAPANAARPAIVVLSWLDGRRLLTPAGVAALAAARAGDLARLALTPDLVVPEAAAFLSRCWEGWWESAGINLAIGPDCEPSAVAALDDLWQQFGTS